MQRGCKSMEQHERIDINILKPYENNARTHSPDQLEMIGNSIREFGFINPVIIDENDMILVGHGRVMAAKQIGVTEVPFRRVTNLSEDQKKAYIIADNKLSDLAGWDDDLLLAELESIELDMSQFGFDNIEDDDIEINEDDFDFDEKGEDDLDPIAKRGDVYQLGDHFLMCGDSTSAADVDRLLKGRAANGSPVSADIIYTDPPYGMNLDTDYSSMKNNLDFAKEKSFTGGKKYDQGVVDDFDPAMIEVIMSLNAKETFIWGADYFAELIPDRNDGSWIVWDKRSNNNDSIDDDYSSDKMFGSCFELCWSKQKHKRDIARIKWAGVFGIEQEFDHKRHHPTQKPIKLAGWFLNRYSDPDDNVIDLFGGSGSTLIACEQLGRRCYMMEYDPYYVDIIIDRWENFTGRKAVKIS